MEKTEVRILMAVVGSVVSDVLGRSLEKLLGKCW
jgi:ADP-ribosylglycohydrolase